jgi:cephalosporin-C deacetylase-like acetyl esterase
MRKIIIVLLFFLLTGLFLFWYVFFSLKAQEMSQQEIISSYEYQPDNRNLQLTEISYRTFQFSYTSFDGDTVNGQISYPRKERESYPVLIGLAAMGRSYLRWRTDSVDGRPTVTNVNKITELADATGYVVVAIDARYHGTRKDPDHPLSAIMNDLRYFGDRTDYQAMIRNTVLDHRVLLDWIERQDNLDINRITIAGYSMGGQISLLLGSLDERISTVIAIVPPWVDDKIAIVAPKNLVSLLHDKPVLLITASRDEEASGSENEQLFEMISSSQKQRHDIAGSHILPVEYVDLLADWL